MRRDLFRAVESVLFNYYAFIKQLNLREEFIKSKCNCFDGFIKPGGSAASTSVEESVLLFKEKDPEYQLLQAKINAIKYAYESLPKYLQRLVSLYYFDRLERYVVIEKLAISEREFYRQRRKAVERCAPYILGPFGM